MFFIKRAWLYVKRKLGKVAMIGTILFVVSTLVLTGLLIKSASNSTFEVARNKLGASVSYTSDLSSVMQNNNGERPEGGKGFSLSLPDDYKAITTKEIEDIAKNSKYVKNYTISATMAGEAIDFNYYNPSGDESDEEEDTTTIEGNGSQISIARMNANINITGVETEKKDTLFHSDDNTLVDGRYFTDEEIDNASNVIIIEKTIADLNSIKVGNSITIEMQGRRKITNGTVEAEEENPQIKYEVVGIYKTKNPTDISNSNFFGAFGLTENTMYAPYTTVLSSRLAGLEGEELEEAKSKIKEEGYEVQSVTFNLNNPSDINAFIDEVKNMKDIDTTYRTLNANDAAYEKMVGPIENVSKTSSVLVIVVVLAGAFIIGLLSMLSIKDRKYELGVLLSLGESRTKIIAQLIFEMIIVSVVSFGLAALVSNFTAQGVSNYLLNQEIASTEENTTNTRGGPFGGSGMFRIETGSLQNLDVDTIDKLTVEVNSNDIFKMFGIGIIVIILGNIVQASFVLRCRPKEILLER